MKFSLLNFSVNESIELVSADGFGSVSSDGVDDVLELFIRISILELLIDISHIIEVKFALALGVQKSEVVSSSFLRERRSLYLTYLLRL